MENNRYIIYIGNESSRNIFLPILWPWPVTSLGDRVVMIPNAIWYIAGTPKVAVD